MAMGVIILFIGGSFYFAQCARARCPCYDSALPLCLSSISCTLDAGTRSSFIVWPVLRSIWPKERTPVGHDWTQALQRTQCGSAMGVPVLAKFIRSMAGLLE